MSLVGSRRTRQNRWCECPGPDLIRRPHGVDTGADVHISFGDASPRFRRVETAFRPKPSG